MKKQIKFNLSIDQDLRELMTECKREFGISISHNVREILRDYLNGLLDMRK